MSMHPLASVIQSLAAARPQAPDAEQPLDSSSPTQLGDAPATQASQAHEDAGPSDGQPADPESNSSWLSAMVSELINTEVKTALDLTLLPRTRQIEQELAIMQQDADSVTNKSKEEQAEVEEELARMAKLVIDFQSRISRFLPNEVTLVDSTDPTTPE